MSQQWSLGNGGGSTDGREVGFAFEERREFRSEAEALKVNQ